MREGIPSEVMNVQIPYFVLSDSRSIKLTSEFQFYIHQILLFCVENKGLEIFCYVIMSTHLHLIARAKNDNLSDVVRDFKKFTSEKLIHEIRLSNDERKDYMLTIFNTGGQKQKKKSNNQLWQFNYLEIIYLRALLRTESPLALAYTQDSPSAGIYT